MTFQQTVNITQAPGVEGDFASANPRFSVPSTMVDNPVNGGAGFRAGAGGVTIGRFAWADVATNMLVLNAGSGAPTGFVGRAGLEGTNFTYFTQPSVGFVIPAGFAVGNFFSGGTFWVRNTGAGAVAVGQKAFASNTTGQIQFGDTGATIAGYTETKWYAATTGAAGELVKMTSQPLG